MAQRGEALQDDARAATHMEHAVQGALVEDQRPRRRGRRGALPEQASETAKSRFGGQQGRRKRNVKAKGRGLRHAEEGAVVPPTFPTREEPKMPHTDKSSYDAIKEVV